MNSKKVWRLRNLILCWRDCCERKIRNWPNFSGKLPKLWFHAMDFSVLYFDHFNNGSSPSIHAKFGLLATVPHFVFFNFSWQLRLLSLAQIWYRTSHALCRSVGSCEIPDWGLWSSVTIVCLRIATSRPVSGYCPYLRCWASTSFIPGLWIERDCRWTASRIHHSSTSWWNSEELSCGIALSYSSSYWTPGS
jgi:hypothetical protein